MGCAATKPLPASTEVPNVGNENTVLTSSTPQDNSSTGAVKDNAAQDKPVGDALLKMAMDADTYDEVEKIVRADDNVRSEFKHNGDGGNNSSPMKSRLILGDPQPEEVGPVMLPDVSYSMRGSPGQAAASHPNDELNQPVSSVSPTKKIIAVQGAGQMQPRQSGAGGQVPFIVPLQQPQVARAPGWVSVPPQRGRGGPIAPVSAGYRGPPQTANVPVPRGSIPVVRGRGGPIHVMGPGDRNATHGGQRKPFPIVANASPSRQHLGVNAQRNGVDSTDSSNDDADEEDDDEDLQAEDEEVEDWDLGDGSNSTDNPSKESRVVSPLKPKQKESPTQTVQPPFKRDLPQHSVARGSISLLHPPSQQHELPEPRRSSGFQPKFRPALELTDDIENVESDSGGSSDDSDEDAANESGDEIHDWLDAPAEPSPGVSSPKRSVNSVKPSMALPAALEIPQPSFGTQSPPSTRPNSRHLYGLSIVPPVQTQTNTSLGVTGSVSPQIPGRTPQPPPYRQGNMSPTRSAGANLHMAIPGTPSPVKQSSYRTGIMKNVAPVVIPLVMVGDQSPGKLAPSPGPSSPAAAIRDTKVVKKKKAELPQHNLPHPVPKFGDWLNSRTMINNYIILESLGTGGYAEVKLCKEKLSGKLFAMKFISRDVMKKDKLGKQSKLDDIKREIAIMKKLNHPNVLRLYEVMDDPKINKLFLVLEYMNHGDMLSYQKKKHPQGMLENLRDRDLHSVFLQVILGLAYLHEQKIVHGDIKPQNLLVGEKDVVKIADFGISQSLYGSKQKIADVAGTPAFMSPEMCSGDEYSGQLADVWALGATIFMLKFGNPPFLAKSAMQMFERIQNDPLVFPGSIDPLLAHLLNGMLTKVPQKRLTLLDVMTHPWVTKNEKHSVPLNASPQITVSKDEIDHAVGANHIALLVNIRKQMLKRLKVARERLAAKHTSGAHTVSTSGNSDWDNSTLVFAQSPKSINARTLTKANKVHAAHPDSGTDTDTDVEKDSNTDGRKVLSNEEIDFRSQLFSRKKMSNRNALDVAPSGASELVNIGDGVAVSHAHYDNHVLSDGLDDEDALSDEDDELAVSQSPQLLDELLLTTLSMPPLTKTAADPVNMPSLFVSRGEVKASSSSSVHFTTSNGNLSKATGSYDDQRFYGESPMLGLHFGVSSLQGRRNTQEDRWVVFPAIGAALDCDNGPRNSWMSQVAYVGLYDGHGGEECANILHEQLHKWIFRPNETPTLACKNFRECFETLDLSVCDYLLHKDDLSGSTATSVVLRSASNGKVLLTIGHVGDCRLVLSKRDGRTVELTQDHRLTLETERDRVIQLGGRVVNNRVNGVMAITRAFGDLEFKGMLDRHHGVGNISGSENFGSFGRAYREDERIPPLLTATPDVQDVEIDPNEDAFLILACDGLWDVVTSEEATAIFHDRIKLHGDLQLAAHELAQEGIRRYSNDNITVVGILVQSPTQSRT